MKRGFRNRWSRIVVTVFVGIGAAPAVLAQQKCDSDNNRIHAASLAAGQTAGVMCSAVFLAKRPPHLVRQEELNELALVPGELYPVGVDVEHASRSVVAVSPYGCERRAAYREGLGCVLMPPGFGRKDIDRLPSAPLPPPPGNPATMPWPDGDLLPQEPLPGEIDSTALAAVIERAFKGMEYQPGFTISVVVVYRGRIIAERYAPGWDINTPYRTWSAAKSMTSALVGLMVDSGKLVLHAPAPIPEWQRQGDARSHITLANLLQMSSGLESGGAGGEGASYTNRAYWGGVDTVELITSTKLGANPGTRWTYANFDSLLLLRAIKAVVADNRRYLTFPRQALFHRIGMRHTVMETDAYGNFIGSSQTYTTARDLARFGLLFLNEGTWNGERILSEDWIRFAVSPPPAHPTAAYSAQWWLLGSDPRVPDDAYSTNGARGQFSTVVPSKQLVLVRQGLDPFSGAGWSQARFVADVIATIGEPNAP